MLTSSFFFFNDTATTEIYTLSLHDALPIFDYNGHCSIRLDDNRILINIGSCQRSRLTVDDICIIDLEANQIEGKGNAPPERHLHFGIYRVRSDVKAIVHAHPKGSTFLTLGGESYQPVYAQGSLVHP